MSLSVTTIGQRSNAHGISHLNVLVELEQWGVEDVGQGKGLRLYIELVPRQVLDPLPVPLQHGLVQHHLEQRAGLVEVVNLLLQLVESLPLFQCLGQLAAPVESGEGEREREGGRERDDGKWPWPPLPPLWHRQTSYKWWL